MKRKIGYSIIFPLFLVLLTDSLNAQSDSATASATSQLMSAKRYEFFAETMSPMSGRMRQLTGYYSLIVTPDTVSADLPYAGRAYSAPMDPGNTGISFVSTAFTYKSEDRKKGGWDIEIKPTDNTNVQKLILTVYDNGKAYLQVSSNQRQPVSFNGRVQPITLIKKQADQ